MHDPVKVQATLQELEESAKQAFGSNPSSSSDEASGMLALLNVAGTLQACMASVETLLRDNLAHIRSCCRSRRCSRTCSRWCMCGLRRPRWVSLHHWAPANVRTSGWYHNNTPHRALVYASSCRSSDIQLPWDATLTSALPNGNM